MTLKLFLFAFLCIALTAAQPAFVYRFDAATSGVEGTIRFQYAGEDSSVAIVSAALDFSRLNQNSIQKFDRLCVGPVAEFKWHIHVRWNSTQRSASLGQCSLVATGNHYDPLFACSPDSEHIALPQCKTKAAEYVCNPENYAKNPHACEKGDLSGKFGNLVVDEQQIATGKWLDKHFPLPSENRPNWSIVLHAVCDSHSTRVACAKEEIA